MTRLQFLNISFPNLPYCEYYRCASNQFYESLHINRKDIKVTLNFWYRCDDTVSVGYCDMKEKDPYETHKTIIKDVKTLSQEEIIEICNKYLK